MVNMEQLNSLEKRLNDTITAERENAKTRELTLEKKISELEKIVNTQSSTMLLTIKTWVGSLTDSIDKANMAIGGIISRIDNEQKKLNEEREAEPLSMWTTTSGRTVEEIDKAVAELSLELGELKLVTGGGKAARANKVGAWAEDGGNEIPESTSQILEELQAKVTYLEDYSRRDNLKFFGIKEEKGETWEDCEEKVKQILVGDMKLEDIESNPEWGFVRVHRVGKFKAGSEQPRPVVAKFKSWKVKNMVLMNSKSLQDNESVHRLCEDFSKKTDDIRKHLYDTQCKHDKTKKLSYNRVVTKKSHANAS